LLGCEKVFIDQYQVRNLGSAQIGKWQGILQTLPRLWIELLAVAGMERLPKMESYQYCQVKKHKDSQIKL
jgi:hypothetical protein